MCVALRRRAACGAMAAAALALAGCAATKAADDALGNWAKGLLESNGLKKPEPPPIPQVPPGDAWRLPRKISLRIYAGSELNRGNDKALSLVLRVYSLKSNAAFLQAPYEAFAASGRDKDYFGADVLDTRELLLMPGQRLDLEESIARDAVGVGIVGLFNSPAARRWRFVFDAGSAEKTGLVLGALGCGLTVSKGEPVEAAVDPLMLGGAQCGE